LNNPNTSQEKKKEGREMYRGGNKAPNDQKTSNNSLGNSKRKNLEAKLEENDFIDLQESKRKVEERRKRSWK